MALEEHEGFPIFVQEFGAGERTVLGLHGILGQSGNFLQLGAKLEGEARVLAFDLPGHGQSAAWDGSGDFNLLSLQIANSILGDRPMDLVGYSYGALIALALAMHRPDAVRSLTLVEPILYSALKGTDLWDAHNAANSPMMQAAADNEKMLEFIKASQDFCYSDTLLQDGMLESLAMPVIVVFGTNTAPDIPVICEAIAERMPDVGVASIEGAEHDVLTSHPAQLAGLVEMNFSRS